MSFNPDLVQTPILAIASGLAIWAIGALLAVISAGRARHHFFSTILFLGGFLLGLGAFLAYQQTGFSLYLHPGCYFGLAPLTLHLDALACFFLGIVSVIVCALSLFSPSYLSCYKDRLHPGIYWHCMFVFLLALVLVLLSTNAICFLVSWEIMALTVITLIASDHIRQRARHAALIYLGMTIFSSLLLTGAFLWYYHHFHSWYFSDWQGAGALTIPALLLFFGLSVKSGIWPFHIWMSQAQSEAPSPVTALMSAVMKKVGIYVFIRLLVIDNDNALILAYVSLALGTVSVIWGSLFALLERDLKRLLSYSTVENIGLIFIALSLCLMGRYLGHWDLAYIAFAAALFHIVNHSLCKTGLFIGAGAIEAVTNTRDLAFLGGLAKRMPWTTACFLANSIAIVALPPFNGFASKWMIYQSLFRLATSQAQVIDRAQGLTLVGVLSLVGALSLACYTKAIGICFLGRPRSEAVNHAHELSPSSIIIQVIGVCACLFLGLMAPHVVPLFAATCTEVLPKITNMENIFTIPIAQIALLGSAIIFAMIWLLSKLSQRASTPLHKYITWDCGYGDLPTRAEETGTSFSESIARIFAPLLRYRMITEIQGKDRRHFPEVIKFETVTSPLLEEAIYRPSMKFIQALSKAIAGLQTGSIHLYLLYVFVTLLLLVSVGIRL